MHLENRFVRSICFVAWFVVLLGLVVLPALAEQGFYDSDCRSCHGAVRTCDGCHMHKGSLSATSDQAEYEPGEPLVVTLDGGTRGGWVGGILYDENNTLVNFVAGGPFPVDIPAHAPAQPGVYHWEAAWYGNNNGSGHIERRTPVTIAVTEPPASAEDEDDSNYLTETWGKIKGIFR